ncbi:glycogen debranching N-terminal domain-containing protein [Phytoactinopolyspora endophytica]|uniref:amylo-alpha-1,6-glucosidase n=1 Tax=Phytoactinopolyspora endophytica TaxID=1642495 RepID=UPI00101D30E9|nr:glycogen debranching N-terminal domain-containing protein [Phytoactinopolyspora endophytica]
MTSHDTALTLVNGTTFTVSDSRGDIDPSGYHGVYHRDIRVVSSLRLEVDGARPQLLAADRTGAGEGHWVYVLASDEHGSPTAVLTRHRYVGEGVRERLIAHAYGRPLPARILTVEIAADFADLLELKGDPGRRPPVELVEDHGGVSAGTDRIRVELAADGPGVTLTGAGLRWDLRLDAGTSRTAEMEIRPRVSGHDQPVRKATVLTEEPAATLRVSGGADRWTRSVASALDDLGGLRVDIPSMDLRYLGAGAPWFMALFGRDTLLTGWESLVAGPRLALDVLQALASRQGQRVDQRTGEEPGKILHEMRTGLMPVFGVEPGVPYYGTADATPLFVMLLAEVYRWGAPDDDVRALLPAARAAMEWCQVHGDVDGDGLVEYVGDAHGLANQGWKDSADSMVHSDGTLATDPIALAEVQAYVYAAYGALAELEERLGEPDAAPELRARADRIQATVAETFWLPERRLVAMALDGDKKPLAVSSSNIGHCLWAGVLEGDVADAAVEQLIRSDLATTWGLRTLASGEVAYNPLGYHVGSIWPHDTAIGVAGLVRHGTVKQARRLVDGLLATAEAFGWRLPELLGGMSADEISQPVPYPVACSPQAWSAAAPLLLLRAMLRLEPDVPAGTVRIAPVLPEDEEIVVRGIPLGTGTLSVRARGTDVEVLEAPSGMTVN